MSLTSEEKQQIEEKRDRRREAAKKFAREAGERQEAGFQDFEKRRSEQLIGRGEGSEAIKKAGEKAQRRARAQAADELAQGAAAGAYGGGGVSAMLRDRGERLQQTEEDILVENELMRRQFEQGETMRAAGLAEKAGEFGAVASAQKAFGEEFAADAQSKAEAKQKRIADTTKNIAQVKKDHKGKSWFESDDELGAAKVFEDLAKAETDPDIIKMYEDEAKRIRKEGDFAF